jgi:hypothetical protein
VTDTQDRLAGRTAVYRLFDADGVLLYVGASNNLDVRWGSHATDKPWWSEVADRKVVWFETRSEALAKETRAIEDEKPRYNILGTPRHREVSAARKVDIETLPWFAEIRDSLMASDDPTVRAKALGAALDAIPKFQRWLRLARQQAIAEMYDSGMSYGQIGKRLNISRARVQQIVDGHVKGRHNAERPTPIEDRAQDAGSSAD